MHKSRTFSRWAAAAAALVAALPGAAHAVAPAPQEIPGAVPGQYIVTLAAGTAPSAVARRIGVKPLYVYGSALTGFAAKFTAAQLARLRATPGVDEVEQDTVITLPENEGAPSDDDLDPRDPPDAGTPSTPAPASAPPSVAHVPPSAAPAPPSAASPSAAPAPAPPSAAPPSAAPASAAPASPSAASPSGAPLSAAPAPASPSAASPSAAPAPQGPRMGGFVPWGLTRINHRALDGTGFAVKATGAKVSSYIVDTGIEYGHPDFGGRAVPGYDAIRDGHRGADCNGHGTHVAGVVGGGYTGVARRTRLVSVRVFPCTARTTNSAVVAGIDWVAGHAVKPAVADISVSGRWSPVSNRAVEGLSRAGVFPVVAAGNGDVNACFVSPASSPRAFTVAAIDDTDHRAWFSDWGPCVDIHAPGTDITSAYLNGTFRTMDGTAEAASHVAGIAALYKDTHGDTDFATLSAWLSGNATRNVPIDGGYGTARLSAFTNGL